jgi:hypothetical protein
MKKNGSACKLKRELHDGAGGARFNTKSFKIGRKQTGIIIVMMSLKANSIELVMFALFHYLISLFISPMQTSWNEQMSVLNET